MRVNLNWFQIILILGITLIIFRNSIFFEFEMIGEYKSNAERPILEMLENGGELFLYKNGKYTSTSMGNGTYKIDWNEIILTNKDQSWHLPLLREYNIGKPKILIDANWRYCLIKK